MTWGVALDFDLLDVGRVDGEGALYTFAEGNAANGEGGVDASAFTGDHDARENLGALFVAFANFGRHFDAIANFEVGIASTGLDLGLGGKLDKGMVAHGGVA